MMFNMMNMNKLLAILWAAIFVTVSCDRHDEIWEQLRDHEQRIEQLEKQCRELNSNIAAIQTILAAVQQNDYVTQVMKVMEDGVEVGYSITFAKSGTITIYHGAAGTTGATPQIGVKKAEDGSYYWTSNGEWITDENGDKIPAAYSNGGDGKYITPQFRIVDDVWYVSYDNGNSWRVIVMGDNEEEEQFFQNVTYDSKYVYLTLCDGTAIALPRSLEIASTEVIYASSYGVVPGNVEAADMERMLADASEGNKTVRFNDGTYVFSSTINVPSDVSLIGSTKTVFKAASEASPSILMSLNGSDNVFISHLIFDGGMTSKPAEEGAQTGVSIVSCRSVNIENVEFVGWSKHGLYSKTMSSYGEEEDGKFFKQLQITNCRFYFNYCGNYFDYRCEYSQMLNCVWGENHIGTVNCGGNNSYVSCQWNANYTGFKMENDGSNPAHGGCNGCTFNHNDNQAIQIDDCVNGWTFEGCQIFYGKVVLNESKGVIFNGNIWGSCRFYSTFPDEKNVNLITNTYFQTDRNVILSGNDGSTKVVNCIPDEEEITDMVEDKDWTLLAYTKRGVNSGASNCYFAHCSTPVKAGARITNLYIAINAASQSTVMQGVNVWVVNANTNTVIEKIVDDENMCVQYSASLSKYVLNIEHDRTYSHPIYFIAQATRTSGVGIAYTTGAANSSYLGTEPPAVGDVIEANSSIEAEFAVYCSNSENNISDGSNILAGKILVTIGDSITYGADMQMESNGLIENPGPNEGKYKSYGWQIAQRNNMIFYQKGISGSTMQGAVNSNGTDKGDVSKKNGFSKENGRYTQLPDDIDFMTIMFGWNDAAYGTLGTINDTTNETYCGGFNVVMPYLIHKYPYTTIVLIVPFGTTMAHRQAVRDMAQKWGVGCFDMCANDLPFYYSEESDDVAVNEEIKKLRIELNQVNGAHPGYQGHYAIGTRLEDYLRKCGCYDRENAVFYKVSYSTEHGVAPAPVEKVKVLYSTLFPTLTAEGYTFEGWYMDSEFKTKAKAGKVLYSDATLYAKWE